MRPENIRAWAEAVEFGHPPPEQPPFDQYGTPIFSYHDAVAYLNRMGNRVAEEAALKRVSQKQNIRLRNGEVKDPELPNTQKIEPANQDAEAYLERQPKILFQNIGAGGPKPKLAQRTVNFNPDREACMNQIRKRQAEIAESDRMARQRKILFSNSVPEEPKPELGPYKIPTREPLPRRNDTRTTPKANDTTTPSPQMVLLRNGQTRKLENIQRVRDYGHPEALRPLAVTGIGEESTFRIDCTGTGGNGGFETYVDQNCRSKTSHPPQIGRLPSLGKALPPRPKLSADQVSVTEAVVKDVVDMGLVVSSSTKS